MRISIDATGLSVKRTGTVTYLVEILAQWNSDPALEHEFLIFCAPAVMHHFQELKLDQRFQLIQAPSRKLLQMVWQQTVLPYRLWRYNVSVHWGVGFVLPYLPVCPMVVTIHDMTFDLFPQFHEPIKRIYFPFMIRMAVARAACVLAISQSTAKDLKRLIPKSHAKTAVTLLAPRSGIVPRAGNPITDEPYVLFVGTIEPRKNLDSLIKAWLSLKPTERGNCRLKVIGARGWMVSSLSESASDQDGVDFIGHVSDESLIQHLSNALLFAYPSMYEGFGLPVIEAMGLGVPVLTSDVGATREIAADAAWLVDPNSQASIAEGLKALLCNEELRQTLSQAGLERSMRFSWQQTASRTMSVLIDSAS